MKTLNFKKTNLFFNEYALTNNEMLKIRGGDGLGEPIIIPPVPPVKI